MEQKEVIVKVYSNNSKKSRLKRNKNKFQRVWDAEKQTYVKVRKTKYPVRHTKMTKDLWKNVDNSKAIERRATTPKVKKSVPVNAAQMEAKLSKLHTETKQPARIHAKSANVVTIHRGNLAWDKNTLRYKRAALY